MMIGAQLTGVAKLKKKKFSSLNLTLNVLYIVFLQSTSGLLTFSKTQ